MRGRKPKPTVLKALGGNPGCRPLPENEPVPDGDLKVLEVPEHLEDIERLVWVKEAAKLADGQLKPTDASLFESFVLATIAHRRARKVWFSEGMPVPSHSLRAVNQLADSIRKLSAELGLSPVSRPRCKVEAKKPGADRWAILAKKAAS